MPPFLFKRSIPRIQLLPTAHESGTFWRLDRFLQVKIKYCYWRRCVSPYPFLFSSDFNSVKREISRNTAKKIHFLLTCSCSWLQLSTYTKPVWQKLTKLAFPRCCLKKTHPSTARITHFLPLEECSKQTSAIPQDKKVARPWNMGTKRLKGWRDDKKQPTAKKRKEAWKMSGRNQQKQGQGRASCTWALKPKTSN